MNTLETMSDFKHWACNLRNNTCIGCGNTICPNCLVEPPGCRCNNKDDCYKV